MPKLTDSQLVILTNASQREGGSALPMPKSTKLQGGALRQVLKHLLERRAAGPKSPRKLQGPTARAGTKQSVLIELLDRPDGAILAEAVKATGWQPHSVRGAISGTLKRKLGLTVVSDKVEGRGRVYRICWKR